MEELTGTVESIVFSNEISGFTVARIKEEKKNKSTCIVGNIGSIQPGETILCEGSWTIHPNYGKQFVITNYTIKAPSDVVGIQKYLESGLVEGVGPVYAEKIVKKFGVDTLDIIENATYRLLEIEGIGKKRIKKIKKCWDEQKFIREVMIFLRSLDITPAFAQKIFQKYGSDSIRQVKDNPYQLAKEVVGIGFKIADSIAKKMGLEKSSEKRVESGIEYALWELTNAGHTCYPIQEFLSEAEKILEVDKELIEKVLNNLIQNEVIIKSSIEDLNGQNNAFIWLKSLFNYEQEIAHKLLLIKNTPSPLRKFEFDKAFNWVENHLNIHLATQQIEAIKSSLSEKIHIITGGPGTGKSTITKAIIEISSQLTDKIILAAPTGKAAKRMSQITRKRAQTIHCLLEFDFVQKEFKRNECNPLKGKLIIIDEASMIDTFLMYSLLRAISPETRVIFVGDIDQLPSVGPGYILKDMIESGKIKTTKLTEIFRQAKGSKIILNSHNINNGLIPSLQNNKESDFQFIEAKEPSEVLKIILNLVSKEIPQNYMFDPIDSIQVLSPMKRGLIGSENLNTELQNILNPSTSPFYKDGKRFHVNDKVMQIKNNYEKLIFNGDVGKIISINKEEVVISFDERELIYNFDELEEITLAYAVSVHKYQGSECPCIVMPIHTSHFMLLYRNLLYTGVTRGKKLVYLIGNKQAVAIAVKNDRVLNRYTGLKKALQQQKPTSFTINIPEESSSFLLGKVKI